MHVMRLLAPAKINLHLRVGAALPSGFHPLLTWMTTVGLFDTLTFQTVDERAEPALQFTCDDPGLPTDGTNLVVRAATALADAARQAGRDLPGLRIALTKRIPSGGGLGGGSSDAATTLTALSRLLRLDWPTDRLAAVAATLGSDVAFFLHGPSSVCTGRGEIVRPIPRPRPRWAVLVLPGLAMPTPDVYRQFDRMRFDGKPLGSNPRGSDLANEPDWGTWSDLSADRLLPLLVNDLEPPAFVLSPQLARLRTDAEQVLGRIVRMSGSGSSLFTLTDDEPGARAAAGRVAARLHVRAVAVELAPVPAEPAKTEPVRTERLES